MAVTSPPTSVFGKYEPKAFPYQYAAQVHIDHLAGGTPAIPRSPKDGCAAS